MPPSLISVTLRIWVILFLSIIPLQANEPQRPKPDVDYVRFGDGDRLSGTIIRETETQVFFRSPVLGEIVLPKAEVTIVRRSRPLEVPVEALVGIAPMDEEGDAARPPGKNAGKASPQKPAPAPDNEAARIAEVVDAAPAREPWKGKLEFGLRQQQGRRDTFSFDVRANARRNLGDNELLAKARALYGEQDSQVNNNRYDASFQWRRELGERTFAQSLTSYFQDELKDITWNIEQNFGAGYKLFNTEGHVVNVGAGLTGQYREADFSGSGFYTLVEVFQDYTYRINKRLTIRQDSQVQYSPDGETRFLSVRSQPSNAVDEADNYRLRFNTVLQGKITNQLSMNLRFEFEYDNAIRPQSARTDQRIISSIGYAF